MRGDLEAGFQAFVENYKKCDPSNCTNTALVSWFTNGPCDDSRCTLISRIMREYQHGCQAGCPGALGHRGRVLVITALAVDYTT